MQQSVQSRVLEVKAPFIFSTEKLIFNNKHKDYFSYSSALQFLIQWE